MKIRVRNLMIALITVFLVTTASATAVPSNAFYLRNSSNRVLHFTYACEGSDRHWTHTLNSRSGKYYWAKNGCTQYTITKSTDMGDGESKSFTYDIDAGHRYEIFWDSSKRAWNIDEL